MPFWGSPRTLRRAVDSVLAQNHQALRLVVTNDGDSPEIWQELEGITDSRLIRFDLDTNRGRYYADAVVLTATTTPWFAIHDADDWSDPQWLGELVSSATAERAVSAFAPQLIHRGRQVVAEPVHPFLTKRGRIPELMQLAHHAGVYRTAAIRAAGGPHPAYRVGYDTLLVDLVRMVGPCAVSRYPRYHRVIRFGSLTTSRQTGFSSPHRLMIKSRLQEMYQQAADLDPRDLAHFVHETIAPDLSAAVARDADRLAGLMPGPDRKAGR